jgi:tetratricopeptide (TPR) repeat protein
VAALLGGLAIWRGMLPQPLRLDKGPATASSGSTYDQFQKAQDLLLHSYKRANTDDAVKGFEAVLKADPSFALAEARLGTAYFIQYRNNHDPKLLDMARDATSRALNLNANLAPPYITLSRIAAMQGQTAMAMEQAQKALSIDPRSAEAYGALADVYAAQGKDGDAVTAYQKAIDLAPDDWRWPVRLGNQEMQSGNIKDAIAQFQRGVDLAPDNAVAYFDLGVANMQSGQMDEARKGLEMSLKIEPGADAYSSLGIVLLLEGKNGDAALDYQKSIDLNPGNYEAWGNLGLAYEWSGNQPEKAAAAYRKAIELGEQARAKSPQNPELLIALADYYASLKNPNQSLVLIRQALALAPDDSSIEYVAGAAYETLGQRSKAIPLIARAVARGERVYEFKRNPQLAGLRSDPSFVAALRAEERTKK